MIEKILTQSHRKFFMQVDACFPNISETSGLKQTEHPEWLNGLLTSKLSKLQAYKLLEVVAVHLLTSFSSSVGEHQISNLVIQVQIPGRDNLFFLGFFYFSTSVLAHFLVFNSLQMKTKVKRGILSWFEQVQIFSPQGLKIGAYNRGL